MSQTSCCKHSDASPIGNSSLAAKPSYWRRALGITGQATPAVVLLLLPKCPVCFAMYIALFTGVAISASAAEYLHTAIVGLCSACIISVAMLYLWPRKDLFLNYGNSQK